MGFKFALVIGRIRGEKVMVLLAEKLVISLLVHLEIIGGIFPLSVVVIF